MTAVLALETSGAACSVCLERDGTRFARTEHVERGHSERLLPMVDAVCAEAGLSSGRLGGKLGAVAFDCGPGSFTGVRIAAAAAQAIALAAGGRVVPIIASHALAYAAWTRADKTSQAAPGFVTFIRSRKDLYYVAAYSVAEGGLMAEQPDRLLESEPDADWQHAHAGWSFVGSQPPWIGSSVVEALSVTAGDVLDLALRQLETHPGLDPAEGLPLYLSADSPWLTLEERTRLSNEG